MILYIICLLLFSIVCYITGYILGCKHYEKKIMPSKLVDFIIYLFSKIQSEELQKELEKAIEDIEDES